MSIASEYGNNFLNKIRFSTETIKESVSAIIKYYN